MTCPSSDAAEPCPGMSARPWPAASGLGWCVLALLGLQPSGLARAETALTEGCESDVSDYQVAIDAALASYRSHRFAEARLAFMRAHAACPSARTLRGLGLVALELGDHVESERSLQRALAHPRKPLRGALRDETAALLARVEGWLTHVELSVAPSDTLARLDGQLLTSPAGDFVVAAGAHVLELSALGQVPQRVLFEARAGERLALQLTLAPLPRQVELAATGPRAGTDPALPAGAPRPHASSPPALQRARWLWSGLAVVALAAALGFGVARGGRPTQTSPPIAAQPVATRSGP
ncbi:MAG: hypothetical protein JWN48_4511 [Myxococcaceae bacterium]|nr:hypothetical protein [Myxococcaceae bacterium]